MGCLSKGDLKDCEETLWLKMKKRIILGREKQVQNIQFPMTAVFTTSVNSVIWFAPVLFINNAVV